MPYNCRRGKWIRKQCVIQYVPLQIHYVEKSHFHYARQFLCIRNICKIYFSSALHSLPKCITCTYAHTLTRTRRIDKTAMPDNVHAHCWVRWLYDLIMNRSSITATVHRMYKPAQRCRLRSHVIFAGAIGGRGESGWVGTTSNFGI